MSVIVLTKQRVNISYKNMITDTVTDSQQRPHRISARDEQLTRAGGQNHGVLSFVHLYPDSLVRMSARRETDNKSFPFLAESVSHVCRMGLALNTCIFQV
jgi:hypothetical protein